MQETSCKMHIVFYYFYLKQVFLYLIKLTWDC